METCNNTVVKVAENASDIIKIVGLILLGIFNMCGIILGFLGKILHSKFCKKKREKFKKKIVSSESSI
jgi:phosphotransferase system  glucose/maltose/N-acetylglucosamine-specific IIC component